jgi:hypothetical protein
MRYLVWTLVLVACASTSKPEEKESWRSVPEPAAAAPKARAAAQQEPAVAPNAAAPAASPAASSDKSIVAWARAYRTDVECEAAARRLKASGADLAWRALTACVAKGQFRALTAVVTGWTAELRTRPEAPRLLARILGARGGDLENDLSEFRRQRIPLFSILSASDQPDIYRGRTVAFVGRVDSLEKNHGKPVAHLTVLSMVSRGHQKTERMVKYRDAEKDEHGRSQRKEYLSDEYETKTRFTNELDEAGVSVLGRLARLDPFFEVGTNFVVLGRFEGPGEQTSEDASAEQVVTVQDYVELSASTQVE